MNTIERWIQVKELYQAALDQDAHRRASFLDNACAGDDALRREVESLLAHEEAAGRFLDAPAMEVVARNLRPASDLALVGRILSHYEVLAFVGAGGMGEVYRAHDPRLDRPVALKILPADIAAEPDQLQRFLREAKAASALNHPNVATIYDIGDSEGIRFIAMEYVEGQTLAAHMAASGPLEAADIVDIGLQVADALDAAHDKGIIHRDIKPANLMVAPRGQVKVLDFGVAKMGRTDEALARTGETLTGAKTAVGTLVGSVPYMSPEQVLGREVDHRSDLFSLGVTLYEMATGRLPFEGTTTTETMDRILHAEVEPIVSHTMAAELKRIIHKCLEKDIDRRYQSARDVFVDVRNLKRAGDARASRTGDGDGRRHNLPGQLTSFVGRDQEIAEVERLLATTRLLTLTGTGGCGKTRLALHVAAALLDRFADGVWLVDLGPLSEPDLIHQTVAATFGVREVAGRPLGDALAEYLRPRQVLLVLDNCEHLIAECAQLVEPLLRSALSLHVLATSREGLGVPGETVWRVPSLSLPAASEPHTADELRRTEAAQLFVDRASTVDAKFTITDSNAATVADVCRRLDGIPLAIELAAVRLKVLSLDQISVRLNDRFRLLTGGSRTAVARQRTLEATLDWSYDLLSEKERTLLCRLAVFPGGWTLEAAEEVCKNHDIHQDTILDLLTYLVDKSLVNVEVAAGDRRYRCLETVRQYGRERLVRSGDAERVRDRHLGFFLALVERAAPELVRADQVRWLNRLQVENDNLRSALEWSVEAPGHEPTALRMGAALLWFWIKRGQLGEGRQWLTRGLAADRDAPPDLKGPAYLASSMVTFFQGDYAAAAASGERSLALARQAGDQRTVAVTLGMQAMLALETGDLAAAARLATEGRATAIATGEPWNQGPAASCLSYLAMNAGDFDRAARLTGEALDLFRRLGDKWAIGVTLADLALFRVLDGQYTLAEASCAEGIRLLEELSDRLGMAWHLGVFAGAEAAQGRAVRAIRLWGAMEGLLESVGAPLQNMYKATIGERYIDTTRTSLGEPAFQAALAEGRSLSPARAVEYAIEDEP